MEELFFETGNKTLTFSGPDRDNEIEVDLDEYNAHYFYLDKEKVIKQKLGKG